MLTNLDDADSRISYSGSWQAYRGGTQSSRQWDSSIHSTNQNGASATITFIGTSIKVYCTVPSGSGTNSIAIITLDGQKVATVTRTTTSDPVYYDTWYYSGSLPNVQHTIVITNGGSSSDSPLQLDALDIEGEAIQASTPTTVAVTTPKTSSDTPTNPTTTSKSNQTSPSSSSSSITSSTSRSSPSDSHSSSSNIVTSAESSSSSSQSSTSGSTSITSGVATQLASGGKTVTTIQSVFTASDGTVSTQIIESPIQTDSNHQLSASSSPPVGAIVGAVVGALAIVGIVVLLLCLRRRRRRQGGPFLRLGNAAPAGTIKPTDVTPFNLEENNTGRAAEPSPNPVGDSSLARSEKGGLTAATAAAEDPASPSDELVDLALRRWIERHPEILLNRSALTYAGQSPIDARPSNHLHQGPPSEDLEMGTLSSMYASTVAGGSSAEPPPPAYQSSSKNITSNRWSTSPMSPMDLLSPLSPTTQL